MVSLLTVLSLFLAGSSPEIPMFALSQGHTANISLAFTLASCLPFRHVTPHRTIQTLHVSLYACHAASDEPLHCFALVSDSQFLQVWGFYSIPLKRAMRIFVMVNKRQLFCPLHLVRLYLLPSHGTHSQHGNEGHNLADRHKQRN